MNKYFWKNKKVLITGHTGFKGSWLSIWLNILGAKVIGYALKPYTTKDNFVVTNLKSKIEHIVGDIRDFNNVLNVFNTYRPEIIFHLAAQPIVRNSYKNPKETFDTNIGGTINLLECCRLTDSTKIIINVTSDKCYENKEWIWGYRENDRLGGYDPYSSSKAASEIVTKGYRNSFFSTLNTDNPGKSISSVRAGNVIGGGDWRTDRLIPDCIRSLEKRETILLRNPNAIRPWQHVLEPLSGYITLALKMAESPGKFCDSWNFGPKEESNRSVKELTHLVIKYWGNGKWLSQQAHNNYHESNILRLDISKSRFLLGWNPVWKIERAIKETVNWYKNYNKKDMYEFCKKQIESYMDNSDLF